MYHVAEAQLKLGDAEAMKTAAAAKAIKTDGKEHMRIAEVLAKRGLFDWAEGELRTVLESEELLTENNVKARRQLAEMLHDQQRDKAAGEALEPIATALAQMDVDQFGKRQPNPMRLLIESMHYNPGALVSRMHYFFAADHLQRSETEQALARLNKGI